MKSTNKKTRVLEIGQASFKYMEGKAALGKFSLEKSLYEVLPPGEEKIPEALAQFLKRIFPRKVPPFDLILIIPRNWVMMKTIPLPTSDPREIKDMLYLQASQQTPYSAADLVFDAHVLETTAEGLTRVLWVMVQKKLIDAILDICSQHELHPNQVIFSSLGVCAALKNWEKTRALFDNSNVLVLDLDDVSSEACFLQSGSLIFSKNIFWGNEHLRRVSEAYGKKSLEDFLQQLDWAMNAYHRGKMGERIEHIVVISHTLEAVVLKEELSKRYDLGVHLIAPDEYHLVDQTREVSFAAAVGSFFLASQEPFSLLPVAVKMRYQRRERQNTLWQVGAALGFLIVALTAFFGVDFYRNQRTLQQMQSQVAGLESSVARAKTDIEFFSLLENQQREKIFLTDVMKEIYQHTPLPIEFSNIHLDDSRMLTLQGNALTTQDVNEFQSSLSQSSMFREVVLQYAQRKKRFDKEILDFKIVCRIKQGEE